MDDITIKDINEQFENSTPMEILEWHTNQFSGASAVSSSFQTQSVPLLHMISVCNSNLPVIFLDTGFHFPETIAFRDLLVRRLKLKLIIVKCKIGKSSFVARYGNLYERDPDHCCYINKVEPLTTTLDQYDCWITGIRRDQTKTRKFTPVIERLDNGLYKIAPLASWAQVDIDNYIESHELPVHPLAKYGYQSIGCAPCTTPGRPNSDRSGRWTNTQKTECGIHTSYLSKLK